MKEIQLLMPEMGESVTDATISAWLVSEGDSIQIDQDILEVSTDKVDTEVPSPADGILTKILHQPGEVVAVGKPLALIQVSDESAIQASPAVEEVAPMEEQSKDQDEYDQEDDFKVPTPPYVPEDKHLSMGTEHGGDQRFYSPLVRSIARKEGISEQELQSIPGSGLDGRLTKDDIKAYVAKRTAPTKAMTSNTVESKTEEQQKTVAVQAPNSMATPQNFSGEIVEMDKMRRLIADHMVQSVKTSPHATLFIEADVTHLVNWRNQWKNKFYQREQEKLTFTPLFIEAVTNAIKKFPQVNVSVVDNYKIKQHKHINIGMATALPNGNLIVPVVKKCEEKTLVALAKNVNDLADRARNNKLKPDDTQGGTFTITNIGTFDGLMGTPIINQPQAAILALGAIKKRPVVLEMDAGDVIAVRHMMYLSLTMDHRVIDGALGGAFLKQVVTELEHWDSQRSI